MKTNVSDLYKTWNNKSEFDDMMKSINNKYVSDMKTTYFNSTSGSGYFQPSISNNPSLNLYTKYLKEKESIKDHLTEKSVKNEDLKMNFDAYSVENNGELIGQKAEQAKNYSPIRISNNEKSKLSSNIENNSPTLKMGSSFDIDKSKTKNKDKSKDKTSLENTISSININKSLSKDKKRTIDRIDNPSSKLKSNNELDFSSLSQPNLYNHNPNYLSNKEFYSKVNNFLSSSKTVTNNLLNTKGKSIDKNKDNNVPIHTQSTKFPSNLAQGGSFIDSNNINTFNNSHNTANFMDTRSNSNFKYGVNAKNTKNPDEILAELNNQKLLLTQGHNLEKQKINRFTRKIETFETLQKPPNSSLYKKYIDTNANTKYYFPKMEYHLERDSNLYELNELQWKVRTNRNNLYN